MADFIKRRMLSFKYAFKGLYITAKEETNFRIHLIAAVTTAVFGFIYQISAYEWLILVLVIGFVLVAELFNTAVERIADFVSPGFNENIGRIKDICAGFVLVSALTAVTIGLIIFLPRFFK